METSEDAVRLSVAILSTLSEAIDGIISTIDTYIQAILLFVTRRILGPGHTPQTQRKMKCTE